MLHKYFMFIFLPPGVFILLLIAALMFWRKRRLAFSLVLLVGLSMLILSLPVVAFHLANPLQFYPKLGPLKSEPNAAIVVLGGGGRLYASEFDGQDAIAGSSYERLRYAAYLYRQSQIPILVSAGSCNKIQVSDGVVMQAALQRDFNIPARWVEGKSLTTTDNAKFTLQLLSREHIKKIYLVTHAMHMPRAMLAFRNSDIQVIAAPTHFEQSPYHCQTLLRWIPDSEAFALSSYALYEYEGYIWYWLWHH